VNVTITLSNPSTQTITVVATTVAGTALVGNDFVSNTATLTFAPGATTVSFTVAIVNDKVKEPTETFTVVLSSPTGGASIATGTGTVTIIDNDGALFAAAPAQALLVVDRPLTQDALDPVVAQAEAMWLVAIPWADFSGVSFTIADLPGDLLGYTLGRGVTIDATADGWGWSVNYLDDGGPRMALLTVVLHELGMALGFVEDDPAEPFVMARTLSAGVQAPPLLLPVAGSIAAAPLSAVGSSRISATLALRGPAATGALSPRSCPVWQRDLTRSGECQAYAFWPRWLATVAMRLLTHG
jgi:Calx-beta domain